MHMGMGFRFAMVALEPAMLTDCRGRRVLSPAPVETVWVLVAEVATLPLRDHRSDVIDVMAWIICILLVGARERMCVVRLRIFWWGCELGSLWWDHPMLQVLPEDQSGLPLGMALEEARAKVALAIRCIGRRASSRKILPIAETGPSRALDIIEARSLLAVAGESFGVGGHRLTTPKDVVVLALYRRI